MGVPLLRYYCGSLHPNLVILSKSCTSWTYGSSIPFFLGFLWGKKTTSPPTTFQTPLSPTQSFFTWKKMSNCQATLHCQSHQSRHGARHSSEQWTSWVLSGYTLPETNSWPHKKCWWGFCRCFEVSLENLLITNVFVGEIIPLLGRDEHSTWK